MTDKQILQHLREDIDLVTKALSEQPDYREWSMDEAVELDDLRMSAGHLVREIGAILDGLTGAKVSRE
jgi:hypothetical protein